jgi:hypothetical protein
MIFRNVDPATRDLLMACIPAVLVLAAVVVVLAAAAWWWLSK